MKTILHKITNLLKRERGFTLVEMVTVVAIMGVMAAVAVPMVSSQLGKARDKSYAQDAAMIQTAVDSFFTAADNVRHLGQRQFPLLGSSISRGTPFSPVDSARTGGTVDFLETGTEVSLTAIPRNPVRATKGGDPKWRDGGLFESTNDGNRGLESGTGLPIAVGATGSEEALNNSVRAFGDKLEVGWFVDRVSFQGQEFSVDSRDYFIDFRLLVDAGLLQDVPESASPDTGGGTISGSYSWYVSDTGAVESVLYFLPSNGQKLPLVDDPSTPKVDESDVDESLRTDTTVDTRGFQDGVYP